MVFTVSGLFDSAVLEGRRRLSRDRNSYLKGDEDTLIDAHAAFVIIPIEIKTVRQIIRRPAESDWVICVSGQ